MESFQLFVYFKRADLSNSFGKNVSNHLLKPNVLFHLIQGIIILTVVFAAQVTLAFFAVSFHLRAHEDLREELLTRLQNQYNEIGGEFFSPALDFVQTKVVPK